MPEVSKTIDIRIGAGNPLNKVEYASGEDVFEKSLVEAIPVSFLNSSLRRKAYRKKKDEPNTKSAELNPSTGYHLLEVERPPYNLDYLAKVSESSSANYASIKAKTSNIVGLGYDLVLSERAKLKVEGKEGDAKSRALRSISRAKITVNEWLEAICKNSDFVDVLNDVWVDYESTGNGYLEIGRKANGEIGYIGHIAATTIRVRKAKDGFIQIVGNKMVFFRNFGDKETPDPVGEDKRPNELVHIKKYSPTNGYYGVPDIVAAMHAVAGNHFAERYNLEYFENKAVPRYIIKTKGPTLSAEHQVKLAEFFSANVKGQNHRTVYVPLPADTADEKNDFEIVPVETGIQDSSFTNYHKINLETILMVHRVPMTKVTMPESTTLGAAKDFDKTFKEQVCLAGETLVMTPEGDLPIKSLSGSTARLLVSDSSNGYTSTRWVDAPIKSFGTQELMKVTLSRGGLEREVFATPEHRWFVRTGAGKRRFVRECQTQELNSGDFLQSAFTKSSAHVIKHGNAGVPHGLVFGDGHIESDGSAGIQLFGEKNKPLAKYFPNEPHGEYLKEGSTQSYVAIRGLSRSWKSMPVLGESSAYIYGFLSGWFAADGTVRKNGSAQLFSTDEEALEKARIMFRKIGVNTYPVVCTREAGPVVVNGREVDANALYSLSIVSSDLNDDFFIIDEHKRRFSAVKGYRPDDWKVVSVERTDRFEEVYCAVVEETGNFALADNLLTGNCQPEQDRLERRLNKILREYTDVFVINLNELSLTDEDTRSKIDDIYLKNDVITPNEVRTRKGMPEIAYGDKTFSEKQREAAEASKKDPTAQQRAETNAQQRGSRARDAERRAGRTDSINGARAPQGEGRSVD